MRFNQQEKDIIFKESSEMPTLWSLLKAQNKYDFEQSKVMTDVDNTEGTN